MKPILFAGLLCACAFVESVRGVSIGLEAMTFADRTYVFDVQWGPLQTSSLAFVPSPRVPEFSVRDNGGSVAIWATAIEAFGVPSFVINFPDALTRELATATFLQPGGAANFQVVPTGTPYGARVTLHDPANALPDAGSSLGFLGFALAGCFGLCRRCGNG